MMHRCAESIAEARAGGGGGVRRVTLTSLVESLGAALSSPDVSKRKSGLDFFCGVLEALPQGTMDEEECQFVVRYGS